MLAKTKIKLSSSFRKIATLVTAASLVFAGLLTTSVTAAGIDNVAVTLTPSTANTATVMTVTFTPNTAYANTQTIRITWPNGTANEEFTGGASLTCTGACTGAAGDDFTVVKTGDANFTSAAVSSATASEVIFTLTTSGALDTTNAFVVTIGKVGGNQLTNPVTVKGYSIGVYGNSSTDFGAGNAAVGNSNQVAVSADVGVSLSFDIVQTNGTAFGSYPASCAMGTLTTSTMGLCQYRIVINTNAGSGYTLAYSVNNTFRNADPYTMTAASGAAIVEGTERYGINIHGGRTSASATPWSTQNKQCAAATATDCGLQTGGTTSTYNVFNFDDTTSTTLNVSTTPNDTSNSNCASQACTLLVSHMNTISSGTPAGNYTHTATYTVTGNF